MPRHRPFCSDVSRENLESLAGTASRVDHWILIEYRGLWSKDALGGSGLSGPVKERLRDQIAARRNTKLLFIRRTERRGFPKLRVIWGSSPERAGALWGTEVESYEELLQLDLTAPGTPLGHPVLLVCTHGKHDPCCARRGRPLFEALDELTDDDWAWQTSHVGGDRFSGNMVALPEGLYFGRVEPAEAWPVLDDYLDGYIDLDHYRGRTCYPTAVQAAECVVRGASGRRGIDDLELISQAPTVVFRAGDRRFELDVTSVAEGLEYLTCTSESLRRPRHYAARILRESAV